MSKVFAGLLELDENSSILKLLLFRFQVVLLEDSSCKLF